MNDEMRLQIERYVMGDMSSEEITNFEEQMTYDQTLRNEVELAKQIRSHLRMDFDEGEIPQNEYVGELRDYLQSDDAKEIKQKLRKVQEEHRNNGERPSGRNRLLVAASLTALIIMAGGFFYFNRNTPDRLYARYYQETDLPSVIKRGGVTDVLEDGVIAFQNENYEEAISILSSYLDESEDPDPAAYIYRGVSRVWTKDYEQALGDFDSMINSGSIDASQGLWFKALAYLKMKDKRKAIDILETIVQNPSNFKSTEARELLDRLN